MAWEGVWVRLLLVRGHGSGGLWFGGGSNGLRSMGAWVRLMVWEGGGVRTGSGGSGSATFPYEQNYTHK